ncbi:MAG TPA: hypothetical protein VGC42_24775, partial [Kofleriaceae bacterium]
MRWMLPLGAAAGFAAAVACSGPASKGPRPPGAPAEIRVDLPDVPAKIAVTKSAPTDNNAPDKRSPILDVLKAENERELAGLRTQKEPAYYLAYQLVEQRVVNLESEGGALITDSDETMRNLDVEVRVGKPELDNTRAITDDQNGLNAPLTRRGYVPFGDDKQALTNALWIETDRRYRGAVSALGYVRQDQSTLKKARNPAPDFAAAPAETHVDGPTKLEFDKAQWAERLKRCSAKALRGQATRGSCNVVFQQNTAYLVN